MKTRILGVIIEGGFTLAEFTVDGDSLIEAIAAFAKMTSPHLESDRQLRINSVRGWCKDCQDFHTDLSAVIATFDQVMGDKKAAVESVLSSLFGRQPSVGQKDVSDALSSLFAQHKPKPENGPN